MMDLDRFKEINDTLGPQPGRRPPGRDRKAPAPDDPRERHRRAPRRRRVRGHVRERGRADRGRRRAAHRPGPRNAVRSRRRLHRRQGEHGHRPLSAPRRGCRNPHEARRRRDVPGQAAVTTPYALYEPGRDEHSLRRLAILSELRQAVASDALELHYPAQDRHGHGAGDPRGSPRALAASRPRHDAARRVHPARRAVGQHRHHHQVGPAAGHRRLRRMESGGIRPRRRREPVRARPLRRGAAHLHQRPAPRPRSSTRRSSCSRSRRARS